MVVSYLIDRTLRLLLPVALLFVVIATNARADDSQNTLVSPYDRVSVGNVAVVTPKWLSTLDSNQRSFYDALISAPNMIWNDGVPFDRLMGLYDSGEFDCIVGESLRPIPGAIHSNYDIRFEMVIYGRRGENLFNRNIVSVVIWQPCQSSRCRLSSRSNGSGCAQSIRGRIW